MNEPRSATTRRIFASTPCPYCGVPAGAPCTRPADFRGPDQPMIVAHDERVAEAASA